MGMVRLADNGGAAEGTAGVRGDEAPRSAHSAVPSATAAHRRRSAPPPHRAFVRARGAAPCRGTGAAGEVRRISSCMMYDAKARRATCSLVYPKGPHPARVSGAP